MTRVAFVCVGNAGRSQMATGFATRERARRDLDVDIVTGGTDPRDHVHEDVVEVMGEVGIDLADRRPRAITADDVADAAYVVTMGCSADEFVPDDWEGTVERWDLDHPGGDDLNAARVQREEIRERVADFFDRLEADEGP